MFGFQPVPISNNKCMETPTWNNPSFYLGVYLNGGCNPLYTSFYYDLFSQVSYTGDLNQLCFSIDYFSIASGHYIYGNGNYDISCTYNEPVVYNVSVSECGCETSSSAEFQLYAPCPPVQFSASTVHIYKTVDESFSISACDYVTCGSVCDPVWVHDGEAMQYANDYGGTCNIDFTGIPNTGEYTIISYISNGCLDPEEAFSGSITFIIHIS